MTDQNENEEHAPDGIHHRYVILSLVGTIILVILTLAGLYPWFKISYRDHLPDLVKDSEYRFTWGPESRSYIAQSWDELLQRRRDQLGDAGAVGPASEDALVIPVEDAAALVEKYGLPSWPEPTAEESNRWSWHRAYLETRAGRNSTRTKDG